MKLQGSEVAQKGEVIRKIFYNNDGFHCKDVKTHYFKRYILDNKKNEQLIDKLITEIEDGLSSKRLTDRLT